MSNNGSGIVSTVAVMGVIYWVAYGAAVAVLFSVVATVVVVVIGVIALGATLYKLASLSIEEIVGFVAIATTAISLPFLVMYFFVMDGQTTVSSSGQSGGQELLSLLCFFWLVGTIIALGAWLADQ